MYVKSIIIEKLQIEYVFIKFIGTCNNMHLYDNNIWYIVKIFLFMYLRN